jgi:Flp pilus assembly protein TadD
VLNTILKLFVISAVLALAVTFDRGGSFLTILVSIFVPLLVINACWYLFFRLQMFAADRLAPSVYRRGMLPILRWTCGKKYTAWALCNYGARLAADAQYDAAIDVFTCVLDLDPSVTEYWAHRGVANHCAGHLTNADDDLTQALTLDPNHQTARTTRGYARLSLGKVREAVDDLERVRCEQPEHSTIALYRGHARADLGDWHGAVEDYRLAHELDHSETAATISLARLQATCPVDEIRDGAKAVDNAHSVCVRTQWNDWIAVSVLAAAHAEEGNFDKAVEFAKQSYEMAPDEAKSERQQRIEQFKQRIPFRIQEGERSSRLSVESIATELREESLPPHRLDPPSGQH